MKKNNKDTRKNESNKPIQADDFNIEEGETTLEKDTLKDLLDEELERGKAADEHTKGSSKPVDEAGSKHNDELSEQKDKYIRLLAEFENYKRRTSKERIELIQTAGKDIIVSMLDILDDMDRAEEQMEKNKETHANEGVILVFNKFRRLLESKGLKAIKTLNTDFDVEKDEAISEVPVPDPKMKGKVIAEVQKGYTLNDHLIRYAKVVVGK